MEIAELRNCYKVILDCSEDVEPFYKKLGFSKRGLFYGKYLTRVKRKKTL
jgi:hypothetical protein